MPAPNQIETVRAELRAHPEINVLDDHARGQILDLACAALGGEPWGRKSKNAAGTDLNTDTLTYRFPDGTFEIIDVIAGADPNPGNPDRGRFATWDTDGRRWAPGDNGYWVPALPVSSQPDDDDGPIPAPSRTPGAAIDAEFAAQSALIADLLKRVAQLEARPVSQPPPAVTLNGARVALKTDNGHYLCAEDGGGGDVNATRESIGSWETYTIEVQP